MRTKAPLYFCCTECISARCTGAEFDKGCSQELYLSLRHHNASPTPVTGVIGQLLPRPRPENHPPLPLSSHHLAQRGRRLPSTETTSSIIEAKFSPHTSQQFLSLFSISSCVVPQIQGIIKNSITFHGPISIWTFCLMQKATNLQTLEKRDWFLDRADHLHQICRWIHLTQFLDLLKFLKQGARVERLWKCCWVVPGSPRSDHSGCWIPDDTS